MHAITHRSRLQTLEYLYEIVYDIIISIDHYSFWKMISLLHDAGPEFGGYTLYS